MQERVQADGGQWQRDDACGEEHRVSQARSCRHQWGCKRGCTAAARLPAKQNMWEAWAAHRMRCGPGGPLSFVRWCSKQPRLRGAIETASRIPTGEKGDPRAALCPEGDWPKDAPNHAMAALYLQRLQSTAERAGSNRSGPQQLRSGSSGSGGGSTPRRQQRAALGKQQAHSLRHQSTLAYTQQVHTPCAGWTPTGRAPRARGFS